MMDMGVEVVDRMACSIPVSCSGTLIWSLEDQEGVDMDAGVVEGDHRSTLGRGGGEGDCVTFIIDQRRRWRGE